MHIGSEVAVVTRRPDCIVQEGINVKRIGLIRLVGHLRGGLIDVKHRPIVPGVAHRHARPGEDAWSVIHPGSRPIVVCVVETDAVLQLNLRLRVVIASSLRSAYDASRAWERSCTWM